MSRRDEDRAILEEGSFEPDLLGQVTVAELLKSYLLRLRRNARIEVLRREMDPELAGALVREMGRQIDEATAALGHDMTVAELVRATTSGTTTIRRAANVPQTAIQGKEER